MSRPRPRRRSSIKDVAEERVDGIPASRWGVTKAQFEEFVEVVRVYQAKGLLHNSAPSGNGLKYSQKKFDDWDIGPNIYQVNEQIIKPLTRGGMLESISIKRIFSGYHYGNLATPGAVPLLSWSLMKNPSGINVDLFVSHAWMEGIYEFADHLLEVWPDDCQAAYICFLSNPQNLDASHFLGGLRKGEECAVQESAFYKALHSGRMKQVVMIATQNVQIHNRIWCCLEAYLSMKQSLPVIIGGDKKYLATMNKRSSDFVRRKRAERLERQRVLWRQIQLRESGFLKGQIKYVWAVSLTSITLAIALCCYYWGGMAKEGDHGRDRLTPLAKTFGTLLFAYSVPVARKAWPDYWPKSWKYFREYRAEIRLPCALFHFMIHVLCLECWIALKLVSSLFLQSLNLKQLYFDFVGIREQRNPFVMKARAEKMEEKLRSEEIRELRKIRSVAVDIREAQANSEIDRAAILEFIGNDAVRVNEMLTNLILGKCPPSFNDKL